VWAGISEFSEPDSLSGKFHSFYGNPDSLYGKMTVYMGTLTLFTEKKEICKSLMVYENHETLRKRKEPALTVNKSSWGGETVPEFTPVTVNFTS
jgi:hypothetical protein